MSRDGTAVFIDARIVPVAINAVGTSGLTIGASLVQTKICAYIIDTVLPIRLLFLKNYQGNFIFNSVGSKITVGL